MHPIFEAVYVPAFIKAANANGRVFKDVEELGEALKLAMGPPPAAAPAVIPPAPKSAPLNKATVGVLKGGPTLPLPSSPDSKMASLQQKFARLKVAARVINADVGLDQIINHMKKAKAKKVLAQSSPGA